MNRALSRAVLTTVVAAALVSTTGTAHAYHGDRIGRASKGVVGHTVVNHRTKVHTTIIGTYGYWRVKRHHRIKVRGLIVSAQRCWDGECHGAAKEARLWAPHQLGRAPSSSRGGAQAGARANFCLVGSTYCAAPWAWVDSAVGAPVRAVRDNITYPCIAGTLGGFGVKVAEKTAAAITAEEGLLTVGTKVAGIFGPEGYAVAGLAGCFVGVGAHGWTNLHDIASTLNPFDKQAGVRR